VAVVGLAGALVSGSAGAAPPPVGGLPSILADAAALGPPTGPEAPSIVAAQTQATTLETQIIEQQQQLTALSERYDAATVGLQRIDARLARATRRLHAAERRQAAAKRQLRATALSAYMYGTSNSNIDALFTTGGQTGELHQAYQQAAIGDIAAALAKLRAATNRLRATQRALHRQRRLAAAERQSIQQLQRRADAASATAQSTLDQVQGHLAALVAREAAQQAEADARAAEKATGAARSVDAGQAAFAAQIAQMLGGGAYSTIATDAANQAAGGGAIGGGAARGAGAVALRMAETFLGVPYVWGGASRSGVDCSGLTMLAWGAAGVALPHSAAWQYDESTHIPLSQVRPGDLLFYDFDGTGIDHVVMYVGSGPFGAATIIQAAHTGTVVSFDPVFYFGLVGAGRP
jgi:cell wall-associated NlpC family hydrolase